nr:MAG TPA: addiction module antitoxin [Caudoviricetes sp.]
MAKTETLHMRIDADLKSNAEYLLNQLGMSTAEAVSIFLRQVILNRGLPFDVKLPKYNEETEEAMREARKISKNGKGFNDIDSLFEELDK